MREGTSVVVAVNRLGVGGAQRLALEDIREFLRRGWKVRLLTFAPESDDTLLHLLPEGCEHTMIHFPSHGALVSWRECRRYLRAADPDLIISHLWFSNIIMKVTCASLGYTGRLLAFEQNMSALTKTLKQSILDRALQFLCHRVVAVSPEIEESLYADGILRSRVTRIMMAHNVTRIAMTAPAPVRKELGLADEFLFLSAGRLTHQKALDVLLKAFALVPEGKLLIAGIGEERESLERQAKELGIRDRIVFLGVRGDIPALMKAADCFVFPSRWEGFGMVLLEAMAVGISIVVTDFPSVFHIVRPDESALVVKRESVEELSSAMTRVLTDAALRERLGREAAKDSERFSVERHVDQILAAAKAR